MILVKCTDIDHVIEKGQQCLALSASLVRRQQTSGVDSQDSGFQVVVWHNQPIDEMKLLPSKDKAIGLFAYPNGVEPSLIIEDWRLYTIWDGPVLFVFMIYDTEHIPSEITGNIFSLKEL
jgi:hypothetical protein